MTSKEALDRFMKTLCEYESDTNNKESVYSCWYRIIKEDLERLEKLENAIEVLKSYRLTASYVEGYYTQPIIMFNPVNKDFVVVGITMEEYELLKEVLGDE